MKFINIDLDITLEKRTASSNLDSTSTEEMLSMLKENPNLQIT